MSIPAGWGTIEAAQDDARTFVGLQTYVSHEAGEQADEGVLRTRTIAS